jgi:hypothetical protein
MLGNCNAKGSVMKNSGLGLAIFSVFGLLSTTAFAAGAFCALPAAPTGSAYINADNDGRVVPPLAGPAVTALQARMNFGTTTDAGSAGLCEITAVSNDSAAPLPGYGVIAVVSATRIIPSVTGGTTSIGQVVERIWRKPAATSPVTPTDMCILGTKVSNLTNTDHDASVAGMQYFKINDIVRGGFSNSGTINVGYLKQAANANRTYRIGRTFTSVQHRAYKYGSVSDGVATMPQTQNNGLGYMDLPPIGGAATLNINGVNTPIWPGVVASTGGNPALQEAQVNSNWVDFTTDSVYVDWDGLSTSPVSTMNYVEFSCNSDSAATINTTWVRPDAIRLRQTAQENTTFKEISVSGFAPPGATLP